MTQKPKKETQSTGKKNTKHTKNNKTTVSTLSLPVSLSVGPEKFLAQTECAQGEGVN